MTYSKNNLATASDYNGYAGMTGQPAASAAGATSKAGYLWGVGFGDRGYGETSPALFNKNANELMLELKSIDATNGADGGFIFQRTNPGLTNAYRYSQWVYVNKANASGRVYFGPDQGSAVLNLDGSSNTNPYWLYPRFDGVTTDVNNSNGPTTIKRNPTPGEWVLYVGYLQGSGYGGTGVGSGLSGIYDCNGVQIVQVPDFKSAASAPYLAFRSFFYYSTDTTQRVYVARPRLEQVTGSEPSIAQLIAMGAASQPIDTLINPSVWKAGDTTTATWGNPSGSGFGWLSNGSVSNEFTVVQSAVMGGAGLPVNMALSSTDFTNLRTVMNSLAAWQGTGTTLLPPAANLANNTIVQAHASGNTAYDIPTLLGTLDANRLNYNIGNMTATASAISSTRGSAWGAGNSGITAEFSVTFASEDAARFFFNTGGEVRISLSHPSTASPRDSSWNSTLNGFVAAFRANTTARTGGSNGVPQTIGYYQLTTAYQVIINGTNSGVSPYTVNDFFVDVKANSITGINGAKGSVLTFRVRLIDEQTNAFSDSVASGTVATIGHLRATSVITAKAAPACAVVTAF